MSDIAGLVEELRCANYALTDRAADALLAQAAELAEARRDLADGTRDYDGGYEAGAGDMQSAVDAAIDRAETATRQGDEALAALKAKGQWQPMSTAPKDGTVIDLWAVREATGEADRYADCIWARTVWGGEPIGEPRWQGLYDRYSVVTPTHWMPLPPPPQGRLPGLADATNNPPSDPGTEQRETGR